MTEQMLLTEAETAARLRVSTRTVARMRERGELKSALVGGSRFYYPASVDEILAAAKAGTDRTERAVKYFLDKLASWSSRLAGRGMDRGAFDAAYEEPLADALVALLEIHAGRQAPWEKLESGDVARPVHADPAVLNEAASERERASAELARELGTPQS